MRSPDILRNIAIPALAVAALGAAACGGEDEGLRPAVDKGEIENLFRVDTVSVDCLQVATESGTATVDLTLDRVLPEVGALKPVSDKGGQANRLWSDALSNPLTTGPEAEVLETEIKTSLCEDPLFAVTVANFFANMEVGGVNIGELNKDWLGEYAGGQDAINDKAAEFLPYMDKETLTQQEQDNALAANQKQEDLAEHLGTLLDRLSNEGVHVEGTALNYHLSAAGMVAGKLPEVELNGNQYTGDMLLFIGEAKDGECLVRIGFNVKDQRPVTTVEVCEPSVTTTTGNDETPTTGGGTPTTRPNGDKIVYCLTPNGPIEFVDANGNGKADEPECLELQNNGSGTPNAPGPEGTTSTTAGTSTTQPSTPPTTGPRPTIPPAPPTSGTPPPPTVPTIPPNPTD